MVLDKRRPRSESALSPRRKSANENPVVVRLAGSKVAAPEKLNDPCAKELPNSLYRSRRISAPNFSVWRPRTIDMLSTHWNVVAGNVRVGLAGSAEPIGQPK